MKRLLAVLLMVPFVALGASAGHPSTALGMTGAAPDATGAAVHPQASPSVHPERSRGMDDHLVVTEDHADPHHLDAQLIHLAKAAAVHHRRVIVYFGASWCVACALIKPVFQREENRALLRDWELVQVDVDALPEGPVLGIPFDTIPFLMKLDDTGHVAGTLRGSVLLEGKGRRVDMDAALARFLGT